jgi:ubiquitin-conjugating enzyme (huntingtin interacting protein 2)
MAPDLRRIQRELKLLENDKESQVIIKPINEDLCHLKGTFRGPSDSPYQGGIFTVDITIPDGYPFSPPKVKFDTLVYHPNVSSQTGGIRFNSAICLDILKDTWSPVLTLKTVVYGVKLAYIVAKSSFGSGSKRPTRCCSGKTLHFGPC